MILTYKFHLLPDIPFNIIIQPGDASAQYIVSSLFRALAESSHEGAYLDTVTRYIESRRDYPLDEDCLPNLAKLVGLEVGKRKIVDGESSAERSIQTLVNDVKDLTEHQFRQMEAMVEQCNITVWYAIEYVKRGIFSAPPKDLGVLFSEYIKDRVIGSQAIQDDMEAFMDWKAYSDHILENECEIATVDKNESVVIEAHALRLNE